MAKIDRGMVSNGAEYAIWHPKPLEQSKGLSVPPEYQMRTHAIHTLRDTPSAIFIPLADQYALFGLSPSGEQLKITTMKAISTARRSDRWGAGDSQDVLIGFYTDESSFYTNLFHEVTHNTLTRLGRPKTVYSADPDREEVFCWDGSRSLANITGVPFSEENARLHLEISREHQAVRDSKAKFKRIEELAAREKELLGFTNYERATFVWSIQGTPQIAA